MKQAEAEVAVATERLKAIDLAIAKSINDLAQYFESLPRLERLGILGGPPELPPSDQIARCEEADTRIVIADKNNSVPKSQLVEPFIRLGLYWPIMENYPKAIARFTKAIELDTQSIPARRGRCGALYSWAAQPGIGDRTRARLLAEAQDECKRALELAGENPLVLFDRGWICDELGEYEAAVQAYVQAQKLDPLRKHSNIPYNLACSYAKWGKFTEPLEELGKVIATDDNYEHAARDKDFQQLRDDPEFRSRFEART